MEPVKTGHERLRGSIEATRLGFGLTRAEVRELAGWCARSRVGGICVPPMFVPTAVEALARRGDWRPDIVTVEALAATSDWTPDIVTVANFPTGDDPLERVIADARGAARAAAVHVDVVVPGALVTETRWREVTRFLHDVRIAAEDAASGRVQIKVILETAALDIDRIRGAASAAIDAGAAWLKTSTGFYSAGGATVEAVRLLRSLAPEGVRVKAAGGIRTRDQALAMLDAGADRLGTSAEKRILSD